MAKRRHRTAYQKATADLEADGNSVMTLRMKRRKTMTTVSCLLEKCIFNKDTICTKAEITLSDDHYCIGGCDEGWEFPPEEEEDD